MSLDLDRSTWKRVKFSDMADNISDRVDDPSKAGVDRYVGLEHLDPGSMTVSRWGSPDDVDATKLRFVPGDIIFGRRRAYQKKVSRADFEGICSAHAMVLRARPELVDPDFLPVFLSSDYFLDRAIQISVGSLSPTVNWKTLKAQEFDLPPLDQQRRIADLLWSIEQQREATSNLRFATTCLISCWLDRQVKSLTSTDQSSIGSAIEKGKVRLQTGPFGTALSASEFGRGGTPVIHPANIRDGRIHPDLDSTLPDSVLPRVSKWQVVAGDVVLMRKGDVGRSALVTSEEAGWVLSSDCISVRSLNHQELDPAFLQIMLAAPSQQLELLRRAPGTTMPGINEKSLAALLLPQVDLQVQQRVLSEFDQMKGVLGVVDHDLFEVGELLHATLAEVWNT